MNDDNDDFMTEDEDEEEPETETEPEPVAEPTMTAEEAAAAERTNLAKQLSAIVSRASSANPLTEPLKSLIRKLEA
jgi:hypothetical protein